MAMGESGLNVRPRFPGSWSRRFPGGNPGVSLLTAHGLNPANIRCLRQMGNLLQQDRRSRNSGRVVVHGYGTRPGGSGKWEQFVPLVCLQGAKREWSSHRPRV